MIMENTFLNRERYYERHIIQAEDFLSRYKRVGRGRQRCCCNEASCFFVMNNDAVRDDILADIHSLNLNYGFMDVKTDGEKTGDKLLYFINNFYTDSLFTDICMKLTKGVRTGGFLMIFPIYEEGYSFNTNIKGLCYDATGNLTFEQNDIVTEDICRFLSAESGRSIEFDEMAEEYYSSQSVDAPLRCFAHRQHEVKEMLENKSRKFDM